MFNLFSFRTVKLKKKKTQQLDMITSGYVQLGTYVSAVLCDMAVLYIWLH